MKWVLFIDVKNIVFANKKPMFCRSEEYFYFSLIPLIMLAGVPATTMLSGTSLVTTEPAATIAFSPIVTPARTVALAPNQAFRFTTIGLVSSEWRVDGSSG